MKYTECRQGRVFILRLGDGDRIPDSIETFARAEKVERALVSFVGGVGSGKIVAGPNMKDGKVESILIHDIVGVHEAAAVGTIFPNEKGEPVLHMHAVFGRDGESCAGCVRTGVDVWTIGEVVVTELLADGPMRKIAPATGFELLEV